jgi:hypothetical protein
MTVYVDELREYDPAQIKPGARQHGKRWCHLFADTDEELIAFAVRLGLQPNWAQSMGHPNQRFHHFDLVPSKRALAVKRGAVEIDARERARETMVLIEEGIGG